MKSSFGREEEEEEEETEVVSEMRVVVAVVGEQGSTWDHWLALGNIKKRNRLYLRMAVPQNCDPVC
jgi:hypothetical protein